MKTIGGKSVYYLTFFENLLVKIHTLENECLETNVRENERFVKLKVVLLQREASPSSVHHTVSLGDHSSNAVLPGHLISNPRKPIINCFFISHLTPSLAECPLVQI